MTLGRRVSIAICWVMMVGLAPSAIDSVLKPLLGVPHKEHEECRDRCLDALRGEYLQKVWDCRRWPYGGAVAPAAIVGLGALLLSRSAPATRACFAMVVLLCWLMTAPWVDAYRQVYSPVRAPPDWHGFVVLEALIESSPDRVRRLAYGRVQCEGWIPAWTTFALVALAWSVERVLVGRIRRDSGQDPA